MTQLPSLVDTAKNKVYQVEKISTVFTSKKADPVSWRWLCDLRMYTSHVVTEEIRNDDKFGQKREGNSIS